jgi:gamma-glutamyltranspeptidase / glutathione hydrolase
MTHFDWHNPYPTVRIPVFARNLVATSQPLAAQAGLQMLARGGNAVDAAIAAAAVIMLTEPCSNGLGSDNFAIVWDGTQLHGLNASGTAPAAWTLDYFKQKYGDDLAKNRPVRGVDTVTVPGAVAGWVALHGKLGKLPFADVLAPAIDYAERGFAISPNVQDKWRLGEPQLKDLPGFAQHFLPKGRAPQVGEHFVLPGAAKTLKLIAQTKGQAYYRGEIADAIANHLQVHGGAMTAADLAAYQPEWVTPIAQDFAGYSLHEIPPNGQGIAALMALGILQHTDIFNFKADSADWQHVAIEAMKLAFADTYRYVADARSMALTPAQLLDAGYLKERAKLIDMRRAQVFSAGKPPGGGTIYLTTADASGMMVSLIQSNYMGFGSGCVVPGYGISLQNRGHGFAMDAASPNVVAPGKRPFHTIIPAFLTKRRTAPSDHPLSRAREREREAAGGEGNAALTEPIMSFGVMGGNMQPQGHVQTLLRMLLAHQQPQAACDAPRWKFMQGTNIEVEATMHAAALQELKARGHQITQAFDSYMDFGSGQFIWRLGDPAVDGYAAASDSRRDGHAVGF